MKSIGALGGRVIRAMMVVGFLVVGLTTGAAAATTVIFVRHGEKAAPNGDVPLSEAGRRRADLLNWMLAPAKVTHVFTSQFKRTQETAAPVVATTGHEPAIISTDDRQGLLEKLSALPDGAVALVVGHSSAIPDIVKQLGAAEPVAPIDEHDYDRFVVVTRASDGWHALSLRYGTGP